MLEDGASGYWRLDDTGATAVDETGNVNGSYIGNCVHAQPGALAGDPSPSTRFDGATCYIDFGDTYAFSATTPYTLEAWFLPSAIGGFQFLIERQTRSGANPVDGYLLLMSPSAQTWSERVVASTNTHTSGYPITAGTFLHLATTYDGSSLRMYVNGAIAASTPAPGLNAYAAKLMVGADGVQNQYYVNGVLDEIAIYPTALSEAQLALHHDLAINGAR